MWAPTAAISIFRDEVVANIFRLTRHTRRGDPYGDGHWILIPVTLVGGTLHLEMRSWVERQREHRE
jgi:hypothetical protein